MSRPCEGLASSARRGGFAQRRLEQLQRGGGESPHVGLAVGIAGGNRDRPLQGSGNRQAGVPGGVAKRLPAGPEAPVSHSPQVAPSRARTARATINA